MIIVDNALKAREAEGKPICIGMVGSGFMAQGLTNQTMHSVPGMRMSAIYGRKLERALHCYKYAGCNDIVVASTQSEFDEAVSKGQPTVTEDAYLISRSPEIDVVIDVTGSVEFGARIALDAFRNGKSVVEMNAEVDATIGPILQIYAQRAGVILSCCDGDEPGLQMDLVRWVKGLGLTPRAVVNVKGLQNPHRNPTTQRQWAKHGSEHGNGDLLRRWHQDQLRAGNRRQRYRLRRVAAWHVARYQVRWLARRHAEAL